MDSMDEIMRILPVPLRRAVEQVQRPIIMRTEELRIRAERPVALACPDILYLCPDGSLSARPLSAMTATKADCDALLRSLTQYSLYAAEDKLRQCFITLRGGCRVGIVGTASVESGTIRLVRDCAGYNIRIARQVRGAADAVIPYILDPYGPLNTLIISPPRAGKTTLLRDVARRLADGLPGLGRFNIAIADERGEIASCWQGIPQLDVGNSCDVLDGCPKAEAIMLMIRAMSPDCIITDEIGTIADADALMEAMRCGVRIIASAHGANVQDAMRRRTLASLAADGYFDRYVVLSRACGPGTVEGIYDGALRTIYMRQPHKAP